MRRQNQGFSGVEIIIVLVIVTVVGFVGYRVYDTVANKSSSPATSEQATDQNESTEPKDVAEAPVVESESDLDKAEKALNDADLESSSDSNQLESQLDGF